MPEHRVGTQEEWQAERDVLLAKEKELTRLNDELAELCLAAPNVRAHINGKDVVKRVVVPGKLVNVVVR